MPVCLRRTQALNMSLEEIVLCPASAWSGNRWAGASIHPSRAPHHPMLSLPGTSANTCAWLAVGG